ncbi:hypothetical protein BX666DRAFT_849970 [Dichotomocladium elegans]|nr:hypothetical protein BX666DRAFT_849970 [Dichotomocladium elegans]
MYEFQIPPNYTAIRTTIIRRIKEQREKEKETRFSCPSNGLPSPPVDHDDMFKPSSPSPQEEVPALAPALLELSGTTPKNAAIPVAATPSPSVQEEEDLNSSSCASSPKNNSLQHSSVDLDEHAIRLKIQELQDEKHKLFQLMKTLLSQQQQQQDTKREVLSPSFPSPTTSGEPESCNSSVATGTDAGQQNQHVDTDMEDQHQRQQRIVPQPTVPPSSSSVAPSPSSSIMHQRSPPPPPSAQQSFRSSGIDHRLPPPPPHPHQRYIHYYRRPPPPGHPRYYRYGGRPTSGFSPPSYPPRRIPMSYGGPARAPSPPVRPTSYRPSRALPDRRY